MNARVVGPRSRYSSTAVNLDRSRSVVRVVAGDVQVLGCRSVIGRRIADRKLHFLPRLHVVAAGVIHRERGRQSAEVHLQIRAVTGIPDGQILIRGGSDSGWWKSQ